MLSACGYSSFLAFKDLKATTDVFEEIKETIRSLAESSPYHILVKNAFNVDPAQFSIKPGHKHSLISIIGLLSSYSNKHFTAPAPHASQKRKSSENDSMSRKKVAADLKFDIDYEDEIRKKLIAMIEKVDENLNPKLHLEASVRSSQQTITFQTECEWCGSDITLYVRGYENTVQYHIYNYTKHILRSHPRQAAKLKAYMVSLIKERNVRQI